MKRTLHSAVMQFCLNIFKYHSIDFVHRRICIINCEEKRKNNIFSLFFFKHCKIGSPSNFFKVDLYFEILALILN